jgi:hypothetical protein
MAAVKYGTQIAQWHLAPTAANRFWELSALFPEFRRQCDSLNDIANVVSFLAGPDGGWVNSQVLRANGGFA